MHKRLTATMVLLGLAMALSVWAGGSTMLTISNGSVTVTSSSPTILDFPISRGGDTSYDAFVQYQSQDGTALAGTDYTAALGSLVIPAGATSATIPVTVAGSTSNPPDKTFQMLLLGGGGGSFSPAFSFATGGPFNVTAADINGDGKPDLLVANASDNTVSVLLNTTAPGATTPSFAAQQTFATGINPGSVTAADINGDGLPDLIVSNYSSNTVSVLLNTTAPGATVASFDTEQTFATGGLPWMATTADINGDGLPDLIVPNSNDNTVSVLLNTTTPGATTPSFDIQQTFATGSSPYSAMTADLNGDGKPDLIVANNLDNTVSVLLNTTAPGATTPSFAAQQTFATGSQPWWVTAADINGDGKPDLIVANLGDDTVSVLLNTTPPGATTASFATQQTFATGSQPWSVTAADLTGNGKPDLMVTNSNASTVSVLLNFTAPGATTASFATQQTFASKLPLAATVADINGDGKPDLIVTNWGDHSVSVLLNALNAITLSGSPATGTIHHSVPTATATPTTVVTPTATPSSVRTPATTATPTATASATPTPQPPTTVSVPLSLAFGNSPVGNTVTRNVTIRNTGNALLFVNSVSSNNPGEFATGTSTCPPSGLAPATTCAIPIGFTPSAVGARSATFTIFDNTAAGSQPVALSGNGTVDLTTSVAGIAWPSEKFGHGYVKAFSVTNHQPVPVALSESISGSNGSDFAVSGGTCGSSLAAMTVCTVSVTFTPGALGTESATLSVSGSPDPTSPHAIALSTGPTIPATVLPVTLPYGRLTAKAPTKTKTATVTNLSGFSLTLSESIRGAKAGDFAVTGSGTCGATALPNSSCTIAVTFTPTVRRTQERASMAVTIGSDPTSPHNISLTGTGP